MTNSVQKIMKMKRKWILRKTGHQRPRRQQKKTVFCKVLHLSSPFSVGCSGIPAMSHHLPRARNPPMDSIFQPCIREKENEKLTVHLTFSPKETALELGHSLCLMCLVVSSHPRTYFLLLLMTKGKEMKFLKSKQVVISDVISRGHVPFIHDHILSRDQSSIPRSCEVISDTVHSPKEAVSCAQKLQKPGHVP